MAETPEGAELIDNPVSVAPGFTVENVHVLPGVPSILQAMFAGLKPRLQGGAAVRSRTHHRGLPRRRDREAAGRDPGPPSDGRDRQLPVHAPGQLRHQPGPAQRRRDGDRQAAAEAILAEMRERGVEVLDLF